MPPTVRDIMETAAPVLHPDDPVEHGRHVGVVTRIDVLDALTAA